MTVAGSTLAAPLRRPKVLPHKVTRILKLWLVVLTHLCALGTGMTNTLSRHILSNILNMTFKL